MSDIEDLMREAQDLAYSYARRANGGNGRSPAVRQSHFERAVSACPPNCDDRSMSIRVIVSLATNEGPGFGPPRRGSRYQNALEDAVGPSVRSSADRFGFPGDETLSHNLLSRGPKRPYGHR